MKNFIIYWKHGELLMISGDSVADAFSKAGYGGGAINAIDFWAEGTEPTHVWNAETHDWEPINSTISGE